jgi:hypothetical protein
MLKPVLCVVCEKVIYSQDGVASLINLFHKVVVAATNQEIPANAVAPKEWAVFSTWDTDPGDELKEYFVCVQVFYPDQSPFGEVGRAKVPIERGKGAQMNVQMLGFPVGQAGRYTVKTWVEENRHTVINPIELKIEVEIRRQDFGIQNPANPTSLNQ